MCVACGQKYKSQAQQKVPAQQRIVVPRAGAVTISAPKTVTAARPQMRYPRWRLTPLVQKKEV